MKPEMLYCLTCERWVPVVSGQHVVYEYNDGGMTTEVDCCDGPFTTSEPHDPDDLPVGEPDQDELARINEDAQEVWE